MVTQSPRYLRDARHLNKFIYTLSSDLFYEPLEVQYKPRQDYRNIVIDLLESPVSDWVVTRDGFWFHVHPGQQYSLPRQGWKVHVSATITNAASILKRAARIALANQVPFKFALDRNVLMTMCYKTWPRGGSGKFITLYPADLSSFTNLIELLYAELRGEEGPYILSDKRFKDCRVLYYRYGGMAQVSRTGLMGEKVLLLISPDGEAIPDIRTPYFAPPPWTQDPFPTEQAKPKNSLLNGRYRVKNALAFSNSGGVYLADDTHTGLEAVLKEARAHTLMDDRGNDAIKLLKREQEILERVQDAGIAPKPLESFYAWENLFLAQEYLKGTDIREIMLTRSPLMKVNPSLEQSREYYETYKKIFKSFAHALNLLHERGVVFGDLSANNLKVDSNTYAVQLIDFEGAFRPGVEEPSYIYTPGFKSNASIRKNLADFQDDLYGLAANMLYMLFPLGALSSLRSDLFDTVLPAMLADIGWSQTPVLKIVNGLAKNEITCLRAAEMLDEPAPLLPPRYITNIEPGSCERFSHELGSFIVANMRLEDKNGLFPADPFMHLTNPLSLGFGASGVLYALKKSGFEAPSAAIDWLEKALDKMKPENLAPGFLTGASGIAWVLMELGLKDRASDLIKMANESSILKKHHSYFYGMAGVGMSNLHLYVRTRKPEYLAMAEELGESLLKTARENERGIYWEADDLLHIGYGYGQSGVALFFLRLYQTTGKDKFLFQGRRALEFDLSYGVADEPQILSFVRAPLETTYLPYLEEGSAGIARVALRYGMWDKIEMMLSGVHRKYAGFAGLMYGLGSFVDVFTDAFVVSGDPRYMEMAQRPIAGIRDFYLVKQPTGLATPGDGLFRLSCDYATGAAGVMRTLYRNAHPGDADFVLDEIGSAEESERLASVDVQRSATAAIG
jgi:serine/threonine protein kinase